MRIARWGLLAAAFLLTVTLGCGKPSETNAVADQDELSRYVAEHPSPEDEGEVTPD